MEAGGLAQTQPYVFEDNRRAESMPSASELIPDCRLLNLNALRRSRCNELHTPANCRAPRQCHRPNRIASRKSHVSAKVTSTNELLNREFEVRPRYIEPPHRVLRRIASYPTFKKTTVTVRR